MRMNLILYNYLVLTCLAGYLIAAKFRCDYSYSYVGWLKYYEVPATWSDARLLCQCQGGMLASPTSSGLKYEMMQSVRNEDILTGIHAVISKAGFYTIDGIPLDAINHSWAENEPQNKNNAGNCISLNSKGDLAVVSCNVPRPYMCYRAHTSENPNYCGAAGYRFQTRTNKCYKFHRNPRTFKRAHFVCAAEGGHLAIINSADESDVLRQLFAENPRESILGNLKKDVAFKDVAFIGFFNYGESADWTTIHGQSLKDAGFDQFSEAQPDNATTGEYCGSIFRNGLLNDLWCEEQFSFICEKDLSYPAICDRRL